MAQERKDIFPGFTAFLQKHLGGLIDYQFVQPVAPDGRVRYEAEKDELEFDGIVLRKTRDIYRLLWTYVIPIDVPRFGEVDAEVIGTIDNFVQSPASKGINYYHRTTTVVAYLPDLRHGSCLTYRQRKIIYEERPETLNGNLPVVKKITHQPWFYPRVITPDMFSFSPEQNSTESSTLFGKLPVKKQE